MFNGNIDAVTIFCTNMQSRVYMFGYFISRQFRIDNRKSLFLNRGIKADKKGN